MAAFATLRSSDLSVTLFAIRLAVFGRGEKDAGPFECRKLNRDANTSRNG